MKRMSFVIIVVVSVAVAGCKKKGAGQGGGSGDGTGGGTGGETASGCVTAITNSLAVSKDDLMKMPGVDDKMMEKMKDLGIQHCKDDKWADDVVKCMSDAKTEAEAQGCYGKMTPEQRATMNKAAMELATPPDTGSAGSAGSGGSGGSAGGSGGSAGGSGGASGGGT